MVSPTDRKIVLARVEFAFWASHFADREANDLSISAIVLEIRPCDEQVLLELLHNSVDNRL
jgi:hypothetical protein